YPLLRDLPSFPTRRSSDLSVVGSHRYSHGGTFTISTTVSEIGTAAELLLAKMGDEKPALPDRLGGDDDRDHGRSSHNEINGLARSEEHTSELQSRENLVCR